MTLRCFKITEGKAIEKAKEIVAGASAMREAYKTIIEVVGLLCYLWDGEHCPDGAAPTGRIGIVTACTMLDDAVGDTKPVFSYHTTTDYWEHAKPLSPDELRVLHEKAKRHVVNRDARGC
jgi:hypothetical protein